MYYITRRSFFCEMRRDGEGESFSADASPRGGEEPTPVHRSFRCWEVLKNSLRWIRGYRAAGFVFHKGA